MIGRIRFQRAATVLPALLLVMAGMSSCSENEDVNDVPVPSAEGTGVEFSLGMAGWNESGADNSPKETEWDNQTVGGDGYGIGDDNWDNF